jgi:DNA-binding response OmpR family regulator
MKRILIVEDDVAIARGLKDNLEYDSFEVEVAGGGERGWEFIRERKPDLVILDLMLPGISGFDLCRRMRREGCLLPVLMLTARGDAKDRVHGLEIGADDYVTKPFAIEEVLARVHALLRRAGRSKLDALPDYLRLGDVEVDFERFEARKAGAPIELSRKEFGLLRLLAAREGKAVTREDLLNEVWGYDRFPTTRTVDTHVAQLRAKIEDDPAQPRFLRTIHGVGYKLTIGEADVIK